MKKARATSKRAGNGNGSPNKKASASALCTKLDMSKLKLDRASKTIQDNIDRFKKEMEFFKHNAETIEKRKQDLKPDAEQKGLVDFFVSEYTRFNKWRKEIEDIDEKLNKMNQAVTLAGDARVNITITQKNKSDVESLNSAIPAFRTAYGATRKTFDELFVPFSELFRKFEALEKLFAESLEPRVERLIVIEQKLSKEADDLCRYAPRDIPPAAQERVLQLFTLHQQTGEKFAQIRLRGFRIENAAAANAGIFAVSAAGAGATAGAGACAGAGAGAGAGVANAHVNVGAAAAATAGVNAENGKTR